MLVNISSASQSNTKVKGSLLSFQRNDLNLSANIGTSTTNNSEKTTPKPNISKGFEIIGITKEVIFSS